jgi:hypothetical protein
MNGQVFSDTTATAQKMTRPPIPLFVAAVTFAQSRYPATIEAIHTDTKTLGSELLRWVQVFKI